MELQKPLEACVTEKLHLAVFLMLVQAQRFQILQYLGHETLFSPRSGPARRARALHRDAISNKNDHCSNPEMTRTADREPIWHSVRRGEGEGEGESGVYHMPVPPVGWSVQRQPLEAQ